MQFAELQTKKRWRASFRCFVNVVPRKLSPPRSICLERFSTKRATFNQPDMSEACGFQPEVEAANTREN
jgi:hypothetical protein